MLATQQHMFGKLKILPIHAETHSKGKLMTLTERVRINSRLSSRQNPNLMQTSIQQPRMYRPNTSMLRRSNRSNRTTPVDFSSYAPAVAQRSYIRTSSPSQSRKSSMKRSIYLPKKMLEKSMLETQMNYVFRKVSMIRTDQKKGITLSRKSRTQSTLPAF